MDITGLQLLNTLNTPVSLLNGCTTVRIGVGYINVLGFIGSSILGLQRHLGIVYVHEFRDREFQNFRIFSAKPSGNTQRPFVKYY